MFSKVVQSMHLSRTLLFTVAALVLFAMSSSFAHCDSEDGPLIPVLRSSLESGDLRPTLKWLSADDESEIEDLFSAVRRVRGHSAEAKAVADRLFIETFIRLHRAGEGASYTGIKEAGKLTPLIVELDEALTSGSVEVIAEKVAADVREQIVSRFERAVELAKHQDESVETGREYIAAYVTYLHFVEGLHEYIAGATREHGSQAGATHEH